MEEAVVQNPSNEIAWAFLGELNLLAFLFNQTTARESADYGCQMCPDSIKVKSA